MRVPYRRSLHERYLDRFAKKYSLLYQQSPNRDGFLDTFELRLSAFYSPAMDDAYQSELVETYIAGLHLRQPSSVLMPQLLACQKKWYGYHYMRTEYNQNYPHVDLFVLESKLLRICKRIIRILICRVFLKIINELKKARARGGLREREEMAILRRMEQGQVPTAANTIPPERGFRWKSPFAEKRIQTLHEQLINARYIHSDTKAEHFAEIFSGDLVVNPTVWIATSTALLFLVQEMIAQEMITLPEDIEQKYKRKKVLERLRDEKSPNADNAELQAIKQELGAWLYARITACFLDKAVSKFTNKRLKFANNQLHNRKTSETPSAGRGLVKILNRVSKVT